MKKKLVHLFNVLALSSLFFSCNSSNDLPSEAEKSSYIAIHGSDTARLDLVIRGTTFKGACNINFNNKYTDFGDVKGRISGDTLLGDFHYSHYGLEWKRVAIVLLKKDNQ